MLKILQKETKPSSSVPYDKTVEELRQNKLFAYRFLEYLNLGIMCLFTLLSPTLDGSKWGKNTLQKVQLFLITLHTYPSMVMTAGNMNDILIWK